MMENWLSRVYNGKKREEVKAVLEHNNPPHTKRVWLVGFLRYAVGMSEEEVMEVIVSGNKWDDYNRGYTRMMIRSIKKLGKRYGDVSQPRAERVGDFSLPKGDVHEGSWVCVKNGAGFVMEWIRIPPTK